MNIIKPKKERTIAIKKYNKPSPWRSAFILTLTAVALAGALILRFMSGFDDEDQLEKLAIQKIENKKSNQLVYASVNNIELIGNFPNQVKPIVFEDVVLEQRNQDSAFQDVEYISERKKAWTIQIMDVSKIEIIKDYLATQEKRDQFAYFRYIDSNKNKRYILTFDDFNNEEGALKALENNEFSLPSSILPFPRPFKEYIGLIEQYHLENKVKEYRKNKYREIKLTKTRAPVISNINVRINPVRTQSKAITKDQTKRGDTKNNAFSKKSQRSGRYVVSQGVNNPDNNIQLNNNIQNVSPIESEPKRKIKTAISNNTENKLESKKHSNQDVIESLINQMNQP